MIPYRLCIVIGIFVSMAPKTKRQWDKQPQEFDDKKFVSFEASERYITLMQVRKPISERGFTVTKRENPVLYRMISSRKWNKFTSQPPMSVTSLVREFYANADEHRRGKFMVRGIV